MHEMTVKRRKINILISPAGMAAAYHLTVLARQYFSDDVSIHLCDTNPGYLIAASTRAASYTQITPFIDRNHRKQLLDIMKQKSIDIFLPMIEQELCTFPSDDEDLARIGIRCVSIPCTIISLVQNKRFMIRFLSNHGIPVPHEMTKKEIRRRGIYFAKPIDGYGSKGSMRISGEDVAPYISSGTMLVEELCKGPEVTIETFNTKNLFSTICRQRLETKGGVCTKARIFFDPTLHTLANRVCSLLPLPPAICIQVMKNSKKQWVVTDVNPRLGAGTSMASAYGWSLGSALLSYLLDRDSKQWLTKQKRDVYVVRTYQDIIMKR
ncbi:MAG: ATP-grasp domain-containing protein [Candidatus Gottesmanbacteria bacterium]|nr:ATP-grasp domain-containing protein [Candidatus Gottesmanbacteria bacterium]